MRVLVLASLCAYVTIPLITPEPVWVIPRNFDLCDGEDFELVDDPEPDSLDWLLETTTCRDPNAEQSHGLHLPRRGVWMFEWSGGCI